MILSLKKPVGLGPTKTTKDESSDTHMYLWDTQNVNSIFRNIHFQRWNFVILTQFKECTDSSEHSPEELKSLLSAVGICVEQRQSM